ncbi:Uncharacterized protein YktA, UPF0223 family [Pilibacter termitis]|uniref:Uncharacterized protein YktA, UPF0223 family n=1 Tax=Pilibacter termitis TaxID=263852 RepID=A0A1T4MEF3_9ENTE|nr:UPF0223 family protein [Pilibacter termitis]SJZ65237.1 Uncharacterized protein YktA, UPF0223 family [Pilibacter termitis]
MKTDYQYPLSLDWSVQEMVFVTNFYTKIEQAYEVGVRVEELLEHYQKFKTVVRTIGEEKRLGKQFETVSGYSIYQCVKMAKEKQQGKIKMERKSYGKKSRM